MTTNLRLQDNGAVSRHVMHLPLNYLYWCSILHCVITSFVDITRNSNGDIFTNQRNDTWCNSSCSAYGGNCVGMKEICCKQCQCRANQTSYIRDKNQCIPSERLTSVLFRDENQGKC